MDHGDLARSAGEHQGILHGSVTSANHHDLLVAVQKSVAGRTCGDPSAPVLLLARDPKPLRVGPGRQDDSMRLDGGRVGRHREGTFGDVHCSHQALLENSTKFGCLHHHIVDNGRPGTPGDSRVILDHDSLALQLAAHGRRHHNWAESRTGRVNGRRQSGRARADDGHPLREIPPLVELELASGILFRFVIGLLKFLLCFGFSAGSQLFLKLFDRGCRQPGSRRLVLRLVFGLVCIALLLRLAVLGRGRLWFLAVLLLELAHELVVPRAAAFPSLCHDLVNLGLVICLLRCHVLVEVHERLLAHLDIVLFSLLRQHLGPLL
mmetsp:Transcript_11593/g.29771  ORF Transcript_11593/g.29771 Transcript_11593/m.29771 type:complete len:321 (+) Transcript_11593:917-1879(+)